MPKKAVASPTASPIRVKSGRVCVLSSTHNPISKPKMMQSAIYHPIPVSLNACIPHFMLHHPTPARCFHAV